MWHPEERFDAWEPLCERLLALGRSDLLACRGQPATSRAPEPATSRGMLSSIDRAIGLDAPEDLRLVVEEVAIKRFRQHAANLASYIELQSLQGVIGTMMLMQHYGAPTRLLDWTESIWVGAYFACFADWANDGVIWVCDRRLLAENVRLRYGHETEFMHRVDDELQWAISSRFAAPWVCPLFHEGITSERMAVQQGFFTFASKLGLDHAQLIDEVVPDGAGVGKHRIRIAASLKSRVLKELAKMNITGASLFPGLDGVGDHIQAASRYLASDEGVRALGGNLDAAVRQAAQQGVRSLADLARRHGPQG